MTKRLISTFGIFAICCYIAWLADSVKPDSLFCITAKVSLVFTCIGTVMYWIGYALTYNGDKN